MSKVIQTHMGLINYVGSKGQIQNTLAAMCCSGVRTAFMNKDVKELHIYIPREVLTAVGKTPYGLLAWTAYLSSIGFPCDLLSVKPQPWKGEGNYFGTFKQLMDNAYIKAYFLETDTVTKAKRSLLTEDSFYVVSIKASDYVNKPYQQFVTWTLVRYFYSHLYCNLPDYVFMFKSLYPRLDRIKCLMLAHAGLNMSMHQNAGGQGYNSYYGLTHHNPKLKFLGTEEFNRRLKRDASSSTFVNSFSTVDMAKEKDRPDNFELFDNGKFDELYNIALND